MKNTPKPALASPDPAVMRAVQDGLSRRPGTRALPPWLFYDEAGSAIFEEITELPEYYLTRAERSIFVHHADEIIAAAAAGATLKVIELGAGTATKSQILLSALVRRQGRCLYVPVDVSASALELACARLRNEEPLVDLLPLPLHHGDALAAVRDLGPRRLVLFIGSSIGNFEARDAHELLADVRASLAAGGAVLLGADLVKDTSRLLAAYDDARGVTAAFNLNLLARINRELHADFDLGAFAHVATWNETLSRIEIFLESKRPQNVEVRAIDLVVHLAEGERIHTESSHKYTIESIDRLLDGTGLVRERMWTDAEGCFAEFLLRAR